MMCLCLCGYMCGSGNQDQSDVGSTCSYFFIKVSTTVQVNITQSCDYSLRYSERLCVHMSAYACMHVCRDAEVVSGTLLVILEDRSVTFNNKHLAFHLKCLEPSRYIGPTPYQVQRQDKVSTASQMRTHTCTHIALPWPTTMPHLSNSWSSYDKREKYIRQDTHTQMVLYIYIFT